MKLAVKFAAVSAGLFALSYLGLQHVYAMGAESTMAQLATTAVQPEEGGFLALIMQGQYIAAVGGFLTLLVAALRNQNYGLAKLVPWFATKAGGYVLGFGSAFTLYVTTAMQSGGANALTLGVFGAALAAGFAASGGWEGILDLINLIRGPKTPATNTTPDPVQPTNGGGTTMLQRRGLFAALGAGVLGLMAGRKGNQWASMSLEDLAVPGNVDHVRIERVEVRPPDPEDLDAKVRKKLKTSSALLGIMVLAMVAITATTVTACKPTGTEAKRVVIDCVTNNQTAIQSLAATMLSTVLGGSSWDNVEAIAKGAGVQVGGCALMTAVQRFLGSTRALSPEQSWNAREVAERYRATVAGGAVFHTYAGDL